MIGVDSNVLVRFFVNDDPRQSTLAKRFMDERTVDDPAFISVVVLVELVWALEQIYDYERTQIHLALSVLLGSGNIAIEREDVTKEAIGHAGAANADIADCIIAALARVADARATVTFDREAARRIPGMELLE